MNPSPARHRWFQLHLSTLVVITLMMGTFSYANTILELKPATIYKDTAFYRCYARGWPFLMNDAVGGSETTFVTGFENSNTHIVWDLSTKPPPRPTGFEGVWYLRGMLGNAFALIATLCLVACIFEKVLRRSESAVPRE